jgi:menaquinone-specific isochorismate synthase
MPHTLLIETPAQTKTVTPCATLVSYSIPCPHVSLSDFLKYAAGGPRVYWERDHLPICFAGSGIAATLIASGRHRFRTIQQQADQLLNNVVLLDRNNPIEAGPRLFGGFAFSPHTPSTGLWSAFPEAIFILPRYQLTHVGQHTWLTINRRVEAADDPAGLADRVRQEAGQVRAALLAVNGHNRPSISSHQLPQTVNLMSQPTWEEMVATATQRIRGGDLAKVVLARARQVYSPQPVDPVKVLACLAQRYPSCYRFLFEPVPGHAFWGATPELLAEVAGSTVRTVAMAGSIRRGQSPEEDSVLGQQLLTNPKERHEHALVVEAIQENLEPLVTHLSLQPEPELCRLSNIQHLKTVVEGQLAGNDGILPIVEALHPTPAVGGWPRTVALEMIAAMEPTPRGWYASPIGWLDHQGNGLFAVALRSAVSVGRQSLLFAGAGIMADSIPRNEWHETELKFKPMMDALSEDNCQ